MNFEDQLREVQSYFPGIKISVENEGGVRFLLFPDFLIDNSAPERKINCLFACDNHLGYESRMWFQKVIATKDSRNWNSMNTYILGKTWFSFSYKATGQTLIEKILCFLGALK